MATINTNLGALSAQKSMNKANADFNSAMTRLSSGLRLNAAREDAAGMAISTKMTAQLMGMNQAIRNAADGKNMIDTLDGAHVEVSNALTRLRELAVQSANDTYSGTERRSIAAEARQLISEMNRIAQNTTFNGEKVMDGTFARKQLQIGADGGQTQSITVESAAATQIGAFTIKSNVSISTTGGITGGKQLIVSGNAGTTGIVTSPNMSARELAQAVNDASAETGVQAVAVSKAKLSDLSQFGKISFEVNDEPIGTVAIANPADLRPLRDAINSKTSATGVSAEMGADNSEIILTDPTGKNISVTNYLATDSGLATEASLKVTALNMDEAPDPVADELTLDAVVTEATATGQLMFKSTRTFSVNSAPIDTGAGEVGFLPGTANRADLDPISNIDLSTAEGAADAIMVIDVALQKVSEARGELGAMSNRLDSTVSNLTNISISVESARSQIVDADIAKESTELARGQIVSQAATAMLAQANSSTENIMSLLRS